MERRLAAILAADVVGYTRLMGADEAGTLVRLKALREALIDPEIANHNGRLVKLMGDGALVEFASVVDAVECAAAIQRAMASHNAATLDDERIAFRIGVNLGDVIVEGDDIYGDGVNIAARLEGLAEPGGICISDIVHQSVKAKLDLAFEDLGPQQVKNVAEPVRAYRVLLGEGAVGKAVESAASVKRDWRRLALAGAVAVLMVVAGTLAWQRPWEPDVEPASIERMAFALPEKPSIAVLPFANMSGDPEQDYFADGMSEDLITDLSKISGLFVIARNSSFTYKGKAVDVKQVSRELGVRYVLEGSVRRAGDQVRINAQLIDATTGGHLWAERYDGSLADVFALQDLVTERIVAALALNLSPGEATRQSQKETDVPAAYDAFLQGWEYYRRFTADDFAKAIPHFERAIELDADYSRAYAALAETYFQSWLRGYKWTAKVNPDDGDFLSWGGAREKSEKYLEIAMKNPTPLSHRLASRMHSDYRQFDKAIVEAERALSLDPNDPEGYLAMAWALIVTGQAEEAATAVQKGMRLDPHYPATYLYALGVAQLGQGQYENAAAALESALIRNPENRVVHAPLAVANAYLGHAEKARAALDAYIGSYSWISKVDGVLNWWPFRREADVRRFGEGLIKAGLCCEDRLEEYIARVRAGGTLQ